MNSTTKSESDLYITPSSSISPSSTTTQASTPTKNDKEKNEIIQSYLQEIKNWLKEGKTQPQPPIKQTILVTLTILSSIYTILKLFYKHEKQKQEKLTKQPILFFQNTKQNMWILNHGMKNDFIYKSMKPKLWIGTNSILNSIMAYFHIGRIDRKSKSSNVIESYTMREEMTIPFDGGVINIDWEIPTSVSKEEILKGPISKPVILIMHGINNDASFGYIRSIMEHCVQHGFISAGMNLRGAAKNGGVGVTTPRCYNAAFTGDIRAVVQILQGRLWHDKTTKEHTTPLMLVGYSLGANLLSKFLGEESAANSLPPCIKGGITLGNPLHINSTNIPFPYSIAINLGLRKKYLSHLKSFLPMLYRDHHFRNAFLHIFTKSWNVAQIDQAFYMYMIRNDSTPPYHTKIGGYTSAQQYWDDASSYNHVQNISVPFLKVSAMDDTLIHHNVISKLGYCLCNPNVIVCLTASGGHLGWLDENGHCWADDVIVHFIEACLGWDVNCNHKEKSRGKVFVDPVIQSKL